MISLTTDQLAMCLVVFCGMTLLGMAAGCTIVGYLIYVRAIKRGQRTAVEWLYEVAKDGTQKIDPHRWRTAHRIASRGGMHEAGLSPLRTMNEDMTV